MAAAWDDSKTKPNGPRSFRLFIGYCWVFGLFIGKNGSQHLAIFFLIAWNILSLFASRPNLAKWRKATPKVLEDKIVHLHTAAGLFSLNGARVRFGHGSWDLLKQNLENLRKCSPTSCTKKETCYISTRKANDPLETSLFFEWICFVEDMFFSPMNKQKTYEKQTHFRNWKSNGIYGGLRVQWASMSNGYPVTHCLNGLSQGEAISWHISEPCPSIVLFQQ